MYFLDITRILGVAEDILRVYYKYIIYKYSYKYNCTLVIDGEPWFVGKDVAAALGYNDTTDALKKHIDNEDKHHFKPGDLPPLKMSNRGAYLINESGLYSLILSSKLPTAKKFKHWVTADVLPAIRKTGGYVSNDDYMITRYGV